MEYVRSKKSRPSLPAGPWLVVGLARSGKAAALALNARGETVIGVDSGSPSELEALTSAGIECITESSGVAELDRVRAVVKSPGVPSEAAVILEAKECGLPVLGELELGWRLVPHQTVAITGTNGKTTTTELATHIFRRNGHLAEAAGNVGNPLCGLALQNPAASERLTVICECSSFQLEDTTEFSPEVAVLLNLSPDHLDRHGDLDRYREAKLRVFSNQTAGDVAVLNSDGGLDGIRPPGEAATVHFTSAAQSEQSPKSPGGWIDLADGHIRVDGEPLVTASELKIKGRHNVENAMAAAAAALALGLSFEEVRVGLVDFDPVPHRLEPIAEIEGVTFINDSKATNVESTLAALRSFEGGLHLILGGRGKGETYEGLAPEVGRACRGIYLIGETADQIDADLKSVGVEIRRYCQDLETAVSEAAGAALPGETVLLSPACASFDQYPDYEARGEDFRRLVGELDG